MTIEALADSLAIDDYFLSATNPLATADQRDTERRALALMAEPPFKKLRAAAERRWRDQAGTLPSPEAWDRFQTLIDECTFSALMKAVNGDPARPGMVRIIMPPHDWFGMSVPGSRYAGGPGADQSYAIIPVDFGTRYRIEGQWTGAPPADHNYTLAGNAYIMNALNTLQQDQIEVRPDGRFTLTVGPEDGGVNHIKTYPGAEYLFVRDVRSDWRQRATAIRVEALDPPRTAPWTDEQIMVRATQIALDDAQGMFYWVLLYQHMTPNTLVGPGLTDGFGGLVSQTTAFARLILEADEAIIVTADPAGAAYHGVQLNDYWFGSVGDYYGRTATLNNTQALAGHDGRITYVVSRQDPGIHNWVDPNGLRETLFVARWQRLPQPAAQAAGTPDARMPAMRLQHVKLAELDRAVPGDIARVDAAGRAAQREARLQTYRLRLVTD